ncbi:MAG: hypothetical protein LBT14_03655 [Treponema sp.]|jgi:hypothetical protein|nr:hypothetical protein [Treponema sp.]
MAKPRIRFKISFWEWSAKAVMVPNNKPLVQTAVINPTVTPLVVTH